MLKTAQIIETFQNITLNLFLICTDLKLYEIIKQTKQPRFSSLKKLSPFFINLTTKSHSQTETESVLSTTILLCSPLLTSHINMTMTVMGLSCLINYLDIPRCIIFRYGFGPPQRPLSNICQYICGIMSFFK